MVFAINTFDKSTIDKARRNGFGIEIDDYIWPLPQAEALKKQTDLSGMVNGFRIRSFHGSAVSRKIEEIHRSTAEEILALYEESFEQAKGYGIKKMVFHANYFARLDTKEHWLSSQLALWKRYLQNKPADIAIYLENFVDDTPYLLAQLCDKIGDERLRLCFDAGHAACNSDISLAQWIQHLGKRIGHVHLHNNDGLSDRHWPLHRGIIDMNEVISQLHQHTNAQMAVLECNFEESVRWLQQHFTAI